MKTEPIHLTFFDAARRWPDHSALEGDGFRVTYGELAAWAGRLARDLTSAGVEPGEPVALLGDDTAEVVAGMLAVLLAGGVFVPLDPDFPVARLRDIVEQAEPRLFLAGAGHRAGLDEEAPRLPSEVRALSLERRVEDGATVPEASAVAELPGASADDRTPAYVVFTSGTTGRPKGILGRLAGIGHFVSWEAELVGAEEGTRVSQLTSPGFDAVLRDLFLPLTLGGTVCVPPGPETVMDPERLADWLEEARVEILHTTPSVLRTLSAVLDNHRLPELRYALAAGEAILPADVGRWFELFGDRVALVNLYGPSETTMTKLFHRVCREDAEARTVPIGKPMPGARALVVADTGDPCPPGKLGEIYLRTGYRALGYWRQPELTAQSFVQNPFSEREGDVVYRTGDLGRMREDGVFEFVGRRDQQVKVRGVRIELEAVEERLSAQDAVREGAVAARTDTRGNSFLCAFVVLEDEMEAEALREALGRELPEAMVPSAFIVMEALPRTFSGKVDRRALPQPSEAGLRRSAPYEAPRTPTEEHLCALYTELLGVARVGIRDDFFALGGHSLLATLLLSRVRARFDVELPLRDLFADATPAGLALAVGELQVAAEEDVEQLLETVEGLSDEDLEELIEAGAPGDTAPGEEIASSGERS